ncbi:MAG: histidine kinase [Planctomycetes bacterium]|nr:histidine kinase [Planctomycetota bacterium]
MAESLFEELKRYVGFTDNDARLLGELRPIILAHAEAITDRFYARILAHPGAARVLAGPEQVGRLKQTLQLWLQKLLAGPFDQTYYELRSRIGRRHVLVGLDQFYMFGAMDDIRNHLHSILLEVYEGRPAELAPRLTALSKILDMELAIMLETYRDDLLARLRAEEERRAREKLEALQTMVASLAHEIRNPLNSASLHLTLLERQMVKTGDLGGIGKRVKVIREEMGRLDQLLSDFIAFARPPRLDRNVRNLNELMRTVAGLLADRASLQKVAFEFLLTEEMPSFPFDWDRLQQVITNLLINALDVLPNGGTVWLETGMGPGCAIARVVDSGPGIPSGLKIFDAFVTTKARGTGLGLPIAKSIVELHGGSISAENTDRGACFRITLPLHSGA